MLVGSIATAQDADELLEPEKAFAFSAEVISENQIAIDWTIAPGYYMYLDKFAFEAKSSGVPLAGIDLPQGIIKKDEFFGDVEIFEKSARILLNLKRSPDDTNTFELKTVGQGCNEPIGVCYAPISHEVSLALPPARAVASTDLNSVADLQQLLSLGSSEPEFLDADDAFSVDVGFIGPDRLSALFRVAPGYYLYRDKINIVIASGGSLQTPDLPNGKTKQDPYFGDVKIYESDFDIALPFAADPNAQRAELVVSYQGCADQGICYPPAKKSFSVALPQLISEASADEITTAATAGSLNSTSDTTSTTSVEYAGYIAAAFGTGLLLSFTPCVLPLIPILLGSVVGQAGVGRGRSIWLATVYILGTVITYAVIGAVAGATGEQLQAYFQNIWAIGSIAIILGIMALSMFGLFEIQMPSAFQSRLSTHSRGLGGSASMVLVLGALSALIVGACVSPLLISVLSIAILRGDPWLGGTIMSAMALGMGVILIVAAAGATWLIPKSGLWMERVKQSFGVMLLGVAIYLLGAVPAVPVLLLWAPLLIITGVYMGAARNTGENPTGWMLLSKGVGTVLLIWGVLAMIGGFSGNRDILAPISISDWNARTGVAQSSDTIVFDKVKTLSALNSEIADSAAQKRPVFIKFYADWCTDCVRMEKTTFSDSAVQAALAGYRLLKIDVTDPDDPGTKPIKKELGVFGPPAMLFMNSQGVEQREQRLYGYMGPSEFISLLATIR
ncbi:MAG: protein-disulfide reductase DsbD [Gammaproteobacteria bacterium]|nr:protein-disulfide reductase DsbD [Gammaproteobacteria bacterium]